MGTGTMYRYLVCRDNREIGYGTDYKFGKLMDGEIRNRIVEALRAYGFTYVTMDLMGYRTGSMNETLPGVVK